nr:auxin-responsive protein SAUR72-like [Ipomoea batatas]
MAKGGKLTKLKSVLKKMQSFKLGRANGSSVAVAAANSSSDDEFSNNNNDSYSKDLRPVYVGKSRRRYLVSSDVVEHPLVRELVDRSGDESDDSVTVVGCEVVLFEHLLWMLESADPQPESLDELVDFYASKTKRKLEKEGKAILEDNCSRKNVKSEAVG